jgi:hypothetical protein
LFSTLVNLLSFVVCGIQPSVNAAYKAKAAEINVTRSAVCQKLNGIETQVSAALLRETAAELGQLIQQMGSRTVGCIAPLARRCLPEAMHHLKDNLPPKNNPSVLPQKLTHTRKLPIRGRLYQPMLHWVLIAKPGMTW